MVRLLLVFLVLTLATATAPAAHAEDCGAAEGEAAIAACTTLIEQDPENAPAYVSRGVAYSGQGDYERAVADLTEAIAVDPANAEAYFQRGRVYLQTNNAKQAIADLSQAITLDPDYAMAYNSRGVVYRQQGDYGRAIADYDQAITLAPQNPDLFINRGYAYFKQMSVQDRAAADAEHDREAAIADFKAALSLNIEGEAKTAAEKALAKLSESKSPGSATPSPSAEASPSKSFPPKSSGMAIFVPDLPDEPAPPPAVAAAWPTEPVPAKNFADETTDWGVKEQTVLRPQKKIGTRTPMSIPGARRITTQELQQIGPQSLLIDVLDDQDAHITIPGAIFVPGAGNYGKGKFTDKLQKKFAKVLDELTNKDLDRQIVIFCYGSECWESYNAVLRALEMGYHNVLWYRGGLDSWKAAELPLVVPKATYPIK